MCTAALALLDYFQGHVGPYRHDHLCIIEIPASAGLTGFAMPGLILIGEQLDYELARYLKGSAHGGGRELHLYRTAPRQSYLMYAKGAVVLHGLISSLGAETIDAALRDVLATHAYPGTPATTLDLIAALARRAPDQQALIDESFRQVVRYDLKAGSARYRRMDDGRYRVTVRLDARKYRLDERSGRASEAPIEVPLQVGVYDRDPSDEYARTLYLGAQRLGAGQSEVSVIVAQAPGMVAVEPAVRLVERDRKDNYVVPTAAPD